MDGNKRTALLALETFLEANGYELEAGDDSVAQLFEDLANKVVDQEAVFTWVSDHAHPR